MLLLLSLFLFLLLSLLLLLLLVYKNIPRQTSRVDCHQERRGLYQNDLMDTSKNLLALLRSALICLRGTRSTVRKSWDFRNIDIQIENTEGAIYWLFFLKGHFTCFKTIIVNRFQSTGLSSFYIFMFYLMGHCCLYFMRIENLSEKCWL